MTIFDYVVLFVLVCSIVIGTMRGLVKELLSLLAWIAALVVANAWAEPLAAMLPEAIPGAVLRMIVAFLALFIGVRLLMMLFTMAIAAVIEATGLSLADRGLGSLFGLVRGIVIVLAGVLVCGMTTMPQQKFWTDALLSPAAESAARTVKPYLPGTIGERVKF